jgi:uncharacterized protein YgiB involved in biofilm formation
MSADRTLTTADMECIVGGLVASAQQHAAKHLQREATAIEVMSVFGSALCTVASMSAGGDPAKTAKIVRTMAGFMEERIDGLLAERDASLAMDAAATVRAEGRA